MKYPIRLFFLLFVGASSCTHQFSTDSNALVDVAEDDQQQNDTLELIMDAEINACLGYGCSFDCDNIVVERGELDQKQLSLFVYAGPKLTVIDQDISPNRCSYIFAKNVASPEAHSSRRQGFLNESDSSYWEIVEVRRVE